MSLEEKNKTLKEGDLYKVIKVFGKTFELFYGYYDESDRYSKYASLMEIYPDLKKNPVYTDDGVPFVTAIQEVCEHYQKVRDTSNRCIDCKYYKKGEELFGLCTCSARLKK